MDKLTLHSPDTTQRNIEAIAELFPSVVTETRDDDGNIVPAIDFDLLRQELCDHVVEGPQERYQLDWPGKREALFAANAPIAKTLRPMRGESIDFDTTKNLFIEGDNLEVLKLLQESYLGKIKLIYIDPPYNTGNDFVYNDDFAESTEEYLIKSGQTEASGVKLVANPESNGRFHSDWLSMMYPRLKLARQLLTDDGILLVSVDDNEVSNLLKVGVEIFGETNHVGTMVWKKKSGGGGKQGKNDPSKQATKNEAFVVDHEYVACFVRNRQLLDRFNVPLAAEDLKGYINEDDDPRGSYKYEDLERSIPTPISTLYYELVDPDGVALRPRGGRMQWRRSRERVLRELETGEIVWKKVRDASDPRGYRYRPKTKQYLFEANGSQRTKSARSVLTDYGLTRDGAIELRRLFDGESPFSFPKPTSLLRYLVGITTSGGDLVLDFFAGSGTTAHAVLAQNAEDGGSRRFIMVQLDEKPESKSEAAKAGYASIAEVGRERIRRAGATVKQEAALMAGGLDIGFRSLKVDTTNMSDVLRTPDQIQQQTLSGLKDSVKPDRSGEDLLFQVLIDWGLELSMPISTEEINGYEVFVVEDDALIACFDGQVGPELVRAIAQRQPLRAIFRDSGFTSDDARINAEQIFREVSPTTEVKAI